MHSRFLEAVADGYTLTSARGHRYLVEARVGGRVGRATGTRKARTICVAVAKILGIDIERADEPKVGIAR
jgi:hypothetical protein